MSDVLAAAVSWFGVRVALLDARSERAFHLGRPPPNMSLDALPNEWTVWNEEPEGRVILTYRPDVFDADAFPAACLPTIYVTNGSRNARPGAGQLQTDEWHATLFAEPEIELATKQLDSRAAAIEAAVDIAERFADGEVDYRGSYQVPREAYFEKLDELTGQSE
jgi:hypothetical protein